MSAFRVQGMLVVKSSNAHRHCLSTTHCTLDYRYHFADWEEEMSTTAGKWAWSTTKVHNVSQLSSLHTLSSGIVGWGCCRLINCSSKKPAESAALAMPPAVAVLRRRKEGDFHLSVSFHTAVLHQVRRLSTQGRLQRLMLSAPCCCCLHRTAR